MIEIMQFRYSRDNLGYLLCSRESAVAIDGGAVEAMVAVLGSSGRTLQLVTNTHGHSDHTVGNRELCAKTGASFMDCRELGGKTSLELDGHNIKVLRAPGHSVDSILFHVDGTLITGDTLFNGTVGNCFSGDLKSFYESLEQLRPLPGDTRVLAGHDYVREAMVYARELEPENEARDRFMKSYDPNFVVSTLEQERQMNPYLRLDEPSIVEMLRGNGLPCKTRFERWVSLME